jgi:hypothetical protein
MRRICLILLLVLPGYIKLLGQIPAQRPPQSARQALIEMFLGKGENDFAKHLPDAARQTLIHKGENPENSIVLRVSTIGHELAAQGEHLETFDAGPTLLVSEPDPHEKIEVTVEHDSLLGEEDEIELSFHYYKDGQPQFLPVIPRLTFTLKQEKEIWRLTEVTAAARVPLTDPDYLSGLRKEQDEANESAARNRLVMVGIAEMAYARQHPDRGYVCGFSTLFAPEPGANPGEGQYDPGQGNDKWNGYRFTFSGCEGSPASKFRIAAAPMDANSALKTFCADESGAVKSVLGGKISTCFSRGEVISTAPNFSVNTE